MYFVDVDAKQEIFCLLIRESPEMCRIPTLSLLILFLLKLVSIPRQNPSLPPLEGLAKLTMLPGDVDHANTGVQLEDSGGGHSEQIVPPLKLQSVGPLF